MEFHKNKPIYLQIVDVISQRIVSKEWKEETKIPTVKELAKELEVNHNTLMRSLELLQSEDILMSKRGVGLFLTKDSYKNALELMRRSFYENQVPEFFSTMNSLKITLGELIDLYKSNKRANESSLI
ncbi:DNA-binding transcriptional regulator YhcF (GntR family) [Dysgonomonas alginatilytica]|uniref:DNA-binding transcriptional regulator YhcF (GntR family) n=1 Tax=Dysgonomonas alginatilytica TaxID=1605892 RepID=A0A2V3PLJ0_9BACT|nr:MULTISPECIES: GntR family transcriptional regulator [Dysgonomonas]MBD8349042.1 GntR family transcriptional regulator [Dysgonomonas sp. HGC4]MBF0576503.1 GntR family transcriptional regulator [Dysgonomonas sp. GY617]PXV62526.1 DNA-binding transcriptional regulator YhcF (GntR family) [Dysgonomonas alginatilytica]